MNGRPLTPITYRARKMLFIGKNPKCKILFICHFWNIKMPKPTYNVKSLLKMLGWCTWNFWVRQKKRFQMSVSLDHPVFDSWNPETKSRCYLLRSCAARPYQHMQRKRNPCYHISVSDLHLNLAVWERWFRVQNVSCLDWSQALWLFKEVRLSWVCKISIAVR